MLTFTVGSFSKPRCSLRGRFYFFQGLPRYWISQSILALGDGESLAGIFFFLFLLSNALMAGLPCYGAAGPFFYPGWATVHGPHPRETKRSFFGPTSKAIKS